MMAKPMKTLELHYPTIQFLMTHNSQKRLSSWNNDIKIGTEILQNFVKRTRIHDLSEFCSQNCGEKAAWLG